MDERKTKDPAEATCERLGDLAATAVRQTVPSPDSRQWIAIEARLAARPSWRSPSRLLPALAVLALIAGGGTWLLARRHLDFRTENCTLTAGGALTATAPGAVTFSDGSRVTLAPGARLRVRPLAFAAGAELALDDGEVSLAVVHRPRGRWAVLAGPFRVDVTGTRFSLRWSQPHGRFRIAMEEGSVRISGGPLAGSTLLLAGQALEASATGVSIGSAEGRPAAAPTAAPPEPPAAAPGQSESSAPARGKPAQAGRADAPRGAAPATVPTRALALPPLPGPALAPPLFEPPETEPAPPVRPVPHRIRIGADGRLSNGMTGFAWLVGGASTSFSKSVVRAEHARLLPRDGQLCARGTIAGVRCMNDNLPELHCSWDNNWGVAIGLSVQADGSVWGEDAPAAIALEYNGRADQYLLAAHRAGDPARQLYCLYDYRSGQIAKPAMFTRCWQDKGAALPDFRGVDYFSLELQSTYDYKSFRYCLVGVQILP
jgi:hypothetical protein